MTSRSPPGAPPATQQGYRRPDEPTIPTRPTRRPAPPPRPSPILLGLVYGGIGLLGLAVAAVTFVVIAPPTDLIRREIVAQVKDATGRDLVIAGPASLTLFPTLGVRVADVTLSAPPDMGGEAFLTAQSFDVGVRLLPLLRKKIAVDRLVLHEPVFDLRIDADGRRSWAHLTRRPVRLAQSDNDALTDFKAGATAETAGAGLRGLAGLSLGNIRIVDGAVHYSDERTGRKASVEAIDARLTLKSIAAPLTADGSFVWSKEKVNFDGTLTSPEDLLRQQPAKLALNVGGKPVTVSYDGALTLDKTWSAQGAVNGSAPSLKALVQWLGGKLPSAPGFGAVSVAGKLDAGNHVVRLEGANLALDGATATGTVGVDTAGERPHVVADLKVAGLNLANYVSDGTAGAEPPADAEPAPPAAAPPPAQAPQAKPDSIEDLLEPSGPQVKGYTQRSAGWSADPLQLSVLGRVDVDAKLSVERLAYRDLKVDASELAVALKDRVLKTTFEDVRLYNGRGKGLVTLDATGNEAALASNFTLSGIAAQSLLKDTSGIDWLAGTGDVTLALTGHGTSQAAIVSTLNGKADIAMHNGAIIGFNLAGAMRALSEGKIPEFSKSPSQKTDFSELTGSFVIADGIAKNDDLKLASPLMRATGSGAIDLPQRSLDYTLRPKVVASLAGQGGEENLTGIEIPVHISGPWSAPDIAPDVAGAINNPKAVEAVKEIGKELKGKNAGEIVEDLLGKGENGEPSKAQKLLQKFLGH